MKSQGNGKLRAAKMVTYFCASGSHLGDEKEDVSPTVDLILRLALNACWVPAAPSDRP